MVMTASRILTKCIQENMPRCMCRYMASALVQCTNACLSRHQKADYHTDYQPGMQLTSDACKGQSECGMCNCKESMASGIIDSNKAKLCSPQPFCIDQKICKSKRTAQATNDCKQMEWPAEEADVKWDPGMASILSSQPSGMVLGKTQQMHSDYHQIEDT